MHISGISQALRLFSGTLPYGDDREDSLDTILTIFQWNTQPKSIFSNLPLDQNSITPVQLSFPIPRLFLQPPPTPPTCQLHTLILPPITLSEESVNSFYFLHSVYKPEATEEISSVTKFDVYIIHFLKLYQTGADRRQLVIASRRRKLQNRTNTQLNMCK